MVVFRLEKKRLISFLDKLKQNYELIAPVKTDLVRFETIKNIKDICLKENAYFPLKDYFFRKREVICTFDGTTIHPSKPYAPARVFFGIRRCDLNGIARQDRVFVHDAKDPHYIEARAKSYLLGYHCDAPPSKYCFCGSMDLEDFHDLMFFDRGNYLLVEVGSEKGRKLIEDHKRFFKKTKITIHEKEKIIKGTDNLQKKDIQPWYDHPDWKKGVDMCFSCAACTTLCPTCYCFEISDEAATENIKSCTRCRTWSSCQLPSFTRVAGDHVFRKEREERFKHRIYHQLAYFKQKYGKPLCVGCGRCISGCPTRIDFIKMINEMK